MIVGNEILKYKEDIIKGLCDLIKIRSVTSQPLEGKPFGEGVNQALEYMLNLGKSLGLTVKNVDGYAGHIEYGEGDEVVGVLVHLDVVPEGAGWTFPPFEGVIHEGKIYGRGASDDKGPAIVAVYGLKVLKDLGIATKRRVRVILGTSEETGMKDMEYYFSKEPLPVMAFSPDAEYPIINREKGILQLVLTKNKDESGSVVEKIVGGEAANMVPSECKAYIPADLVTSEELERLRKLAGEISEDNIDISYENGNQEVKGSRIIIRARGKSAHASTPYNGKNAIACLIDFLYRAQAEINGNFGKSIYLDGFLKFIHERIGKETSGQSLGINFKDNESGELTLNLGKISYTETEKRAVLDIRYPVTVNLDMILKAIKEKASVDGISVEVHGHHPPLYIPEDHPLIVRLSNAYEKITGKKAGLVAIGGGTYARTLQNNGVAFGGAGTNYHQPDEYVTIDELMEHARICTQAIYELAI